MRASLVCLLFISSGAQAFAAPPSGLRGLHPSSIARAPLGVLGRANALTPPCFKGVLEAGSAAVPPDSASAVALLLRGGTAAALLAPRDALCAMVGLIGASGWLGLWTTLAAANKVEPKLSRKIVHTGSAPLFLLTWPFFSESSTARFVAAAVPCVFALRLVKARAGKVWLSVATLTRK
jgi:hypothetical protein